VRRRRIGQSADRAFRPADAGRRLRSSGYLSLTHSLTIPHSSLLDLATRRRRSRRYTVIGFPNRRTSGKTVALTAVVAETGQYNYYYLLIINIFTDRYYNRYI